MSAQRRKRRIYVAIMRAAEMGRKGVLLSPNEVRELSSDDAIETHANFLLTDAERHTVFERGWKALKP